MCYRSIIVEYRNIIYSYIYSYRYSYPPFLLYINSISWVLRFLKLSNSNGPKPKRLQAGIYVECTTERPAQRSFALNCFKFIKVIL